MIDHPETVFHQPSTPINQLQCQRNDDAALAYRIVTFQQSFCVHLIAKIFSFQQGPSCRVLLSSLELFDGDEVVHVFAKMLARAI
jgi:hypothetical protein